MKSIFNKDLILLGAVVCIVFGHNNIMASTNCSFMPSYVELTPTSNEEQVFFEAEKLYSVNFVDQSPRTASQATHDSYMETSANKFSNSSERISRNLRGYDLFDLLVNQNNYQLVSYINSYITNTLIYKVVHIKLAIAFAVKSNIDLMQTNFLVSIKN